MSDPKQPSRIAWASIFGVATAILGVLLVVQVTVSSANRAAEKSVVNSLRTDMQKVEIRLTVVETRLTAAETRLARVESLLKDTVLDRLNRLEESINTRLDRIEERLRE